MSEPIALTLPEQLVLLSRNVDNRVLGASQSRELTLAYAILFELLLTGRLRFETRNGPVSVANPRPSGDPVLDEVVQMVASGSPRPTGMWMSSIAHTALRERIARGLCRKGVLRSVKRRILLVFRHTVYEVANAAVESQLVERVRDAIFGDEEAIDARLILAVSMAHQDGILRWHFRRKDLRRRASRLKQLDGFELMDRASCRDVVR